MVLGVHGPGGGAWSQGGAWSGGCLVWGCVYGPGGCLVLRGVPGPGGGGVPACTEAYPPCEQNDKQVQKYYLAPNFVCGR